MDGAYHPQYLNGQSSTTAHQAQALVRQSLDSKNIPDYLFALHRLPYDSGTDHI